MILAVNWVTITSITIAIIIFHIIFKVSLLLNFVVLGPVPSGLLELYHLILKIPARVSTIILKQKDIEAWNGKLICPALPIW